MDILIAVIVLAVVWFGLEVVFFFRKREQVVDCLVGEGIYPDIAYDVLNDLEGAVLRQYKPEYIAEFLSPLCWVIQYEQRGQNDDS